jgi:hypothetical protein
MKGIKESKKEGEELRNKRKNSLLHSKGFYTTLFNKSEVLKI